MGVSLDLKLVEIKCQGSLELPLEDLKDFQGNLKELSQENYGKLKKEILRHGFSEPVSVWKHDGKWMILNGHQRVRTLLGLKAEGYKIPKVPVSIIHAKDMKDAKERVLALTSQFGQITDDGLYEFMNDAGLDVAYLDDLRFPEVNLDKWKADFIEGLDSLQNTSKELDLNAFDNFKHQCPRCGFEWDDSAKDGAMESDGPEDSSAE